MRRHALIVPIVLVAGLLSGCTGTGVFLDHTDQWFSRNPNMPAGGSETFLRIRGEPVDIPPLLPEAGNIWPTYTGPDATIQDIQARQNEEIRRNGGQPATGPAPGGQDVSARPGSTVGRANRADQGLPPPARQPTPPSRQPTVQTPNGPAVDLNPGSGQGYRQLQSTTPGGSGILVPNGNGTSTLIGPDGSVTTVPTRQ